MLDFDCFSLKNSFAILLFFEYLELSSGFIRQFLVVSSSFLRFVRHRRRVFIILLRSVFDLRSVVANSSHQKCKCLGLTTITLFYFLCHVVCNLVLGPGGLSPFFRGALLLLLFLHYIFKKIAVAFIAWVRPSLVWLLGFFSDPAHVVGRSAVLGVGTGSSWVGGV